MTVDFASQSTFAQLVQIAGGILATLIAGGIVRYWIQRRLCVLIEAFSKTSELAKSGITLSVSIFNKGRRPEMDIRVEFEPTRHYSLLARSTADVALEDGILKVARLPPKDKVSAMLLVEGGDFTPDKVIRVASAETMGKVYDQQVKVPEAPGAVFFGLVIGILVLSLPALGLYWYSKEIRDSLSDLGAGTKKSAEERSLSEAGWRGTDRFVESSLGKLYKLGEFPVKVEARERRGNFVVLDATIENKGASWFSVTIGMTSSAARPDGACERAAERNYLHDLIVPAWTKKTESFRVYMPASYEYATQLVRTEVSFSTFDGEQIFGPWTGTTVGWMGQATLGADLLKDFPCLVDAAAESKKRQ